MRYPNGCILVFAKAPLPGYAKTRLIPLLGAQGAADLQAQLIRRALTMAVGSKLAPVQLWTCGAEQRAFFDAFLHDVDGRMHVQRGRDLGARMADACAQALQHADFAVIIGTDCPALDAAYLEHACAALQAGTEVVLGPAEDGGYVLIGLRRAEPRIFQHIDWGTSAVLAQTRAQLRRLGISAAELPTLWDVDDADDFARWQSWQTAQPQ